MKNLFYFLMLAVFILACGKENKNQPAPVNPVPASINGIWQVNSEASVKALAEVSELSAIEKAPAPGTSPLPTLVSFEKYENGKLSFASSKNYNWQEVGTFTLNGNSLKRTVSGLLQECVVTKLTETELNYNCNVIVGFVKGAPILRNHAKVSKRLSVADFDKIKAAAPVVVPAIPVAPAAPAAVPADAPKTAPTVKGDAVKPPATPEATTPATPTKEAAPSTPPKTADNKPKPKPKDPLYYRPF